LEGSNVYLQREYCELPGGKARPLNLPALQADWRTLATPTVLALGYKWPVAFTHDGVIDLASTSKDAYGPFRTLRF
jgi:hypothetical protein